MTITRPSEEIREGNFRCRAFTGESVRLNKLRCYGLDDLRVWDSVGGYFTSCHAISAKSQKRLTAKLHTKGDLVRA